MTYSTATIQARGGHLYTLRKGGVICVQSSLPSCGYSDRELKQLRADGFELYEDGKKVKRGRT